jgi:hypothetical protein
MSFCRFGWLTVLTLAFLVKPADALAAPLGPGNLLVTHGNVLYEYTLGGALVQTISVPRPVAGDYDIWDVVQDG